MVSLQMHILTTINFAVLPGYERIDDMILPTNFFNTQRNAVPDPKSLWPNATVPYVIDSSLRIQTIFTFT